MQSLSPPSLNGVSVFSSEVTAPETVSKIHDEGDKIANVRKTCGDVKMILNNLKKDISETE